jgi:hypothetical protein
MNPRKPMNPPITFTSAQNDWTVLPVHGWKRVHFIAAIRQKQTETLSSASACRLSILEAHGSERESVFARRISSFSPKRVFPRERALPHDSEITRRHSVI